MVYCYNKNFSLKEDDNYRLHHIRSFVIRHRHLTKNQKYALDNYWSLLGIEFNDQYLDLIKLFNNYCPTIMEIGFGMGDSLVSMAKKYPKYNFIGVEVYKPGICCCLSLAYKNKINNLRIIYADAIDVLYNMIPNNSLERVHLFFPDPWYKTRHNKRRIIQIYFVKLIANKLKINGIFHIATDWENYAKYILQIMSSVNNYQSKTNKDEYIQRQTTKFESKGYLLGHNAWDFLFQKIK